MGREEKRRERQRERERDWREEREKGVPRPLVRHRRTKALGISVLPED